MNGYCWRNRAWAGEGLRCFFAPFIDLDTPPLACYATLR